MYEVPGPDELREFFRKNDLTQASAADIVGVNSRTVRKWTASEGADNRRAIPWSAWTLLRIYVGDITLEAFREGVGQGTD